jgi:hypothetical protein
VHVDALNNVIVGAVEGGGRRGLGTRFLVFDRTANGNVKPKMTIRGPRTLGGPFAISPEKKLIIATNRPSGDELSEMDSYPGVWSYERSSDDGVPLFRIGSPSGIFQMPRGVALDVRNKSIIVTDKRLNSVLTFLAPKLF